MTSAADILRERAAKAADDNRPRDSNIIAAVAELMEACLREPITRDDPQHVSCRVCAGVDRHYSYCQLAALERAIEGESDATSE